MKKKALVIGSHVSESLSPLIFNYWFKKHNINASYLFKEIKPENFEKEIYEVLNDRDICGFNVTIPFKELIKEKVDFLDDHSEKIGAVNCVSNINKNWVGKNTDWLGFVKSIEKQTKITKINTALVLGYGGVSKAILYALKKMNFKKIILYNRTLKKILNEDKIFTINYDDIFKEIKISDIIINTTPTNILKKTLNKNQKLNTFAYDVVYRPKETDFLSQFKKEKRIYGISMLIYQAVPCFEDWFGFKPVVDRGLFSLLEKQIGQ